MKQAGQKHLTFCGVLLGVVVVLPSFVISVADIMMSGEPELKFQLIRFIERYDLRTVIPHFRVSRDVING